MASELKQKTAKGLVWGGAITMLQQMLALVFGAIIARILSPSDYGMVGMLNIFTALATVLQESGFVYVLTNREGINKIEYSSVFW
ncbi:MAG: oligosaccharide flippase family protein, partial [Aeriscardovia sp.]|nr:oligosaccharide flippase family protein [Aeriscardovia sp.]